MKKRLLGHHPKYEKLNHISKQNKTKNLEGSTVGKLHTNNGADLLDIKKVLKKKKPPIRI